MLLVPSFKDTGSGVSILSRCPLRSPHVPRSKIVENLAVVNYDTNNLYLAPYDWRLSFYNLEERDGYFSKLKSAIELFKRRQKRKVVVAAHSMGATVSKSPWWTGSHWFIPSPEVVLVSYCLLAITISSQLTRYSFRSSICKSSLAIETTYISPRLSFKWVEAPKYGAGGPNWVEVWRDFHPCEHRFIWLPFARIILKHISR